MAEITSSKRNELRPMMLAGWRLWFWWVLASTVGWAVGGFVGVGVSPGLSIDIIVAGSIGVATGGILAGVLQWLVLRRQVPLAGWWVAASPIGAALTGFLGVFAGVLGGADVGWVVGAGVFGTVLGVLQWLVLRRQFARAGWWVLVSTLAWILAGPTSGIVDSAVGVNLSWAVLGAVYGAVTGFFLVRLMSRPIPTSYGEE